MAPRRSNKAASAGASGDAVASSQESLDSAGASQSSTGPAGPAAAPHSRAGRRTPATAHRHDQPANPANAAGATAAAAAAGADGRSAAGSGVEEKKTSTTTMDGVADDDVFAPLSPLGKLLARLATLVAPAVPATLDAMTTFLAAAVDGLAPAARSRFGPQLRTSAGAAALLALVSAARRADAEVVGKAEPIIQKIAEAATTVGLQDAPVAALTDDAIKSLTPAQLAKLALRDDAPAGVLSKLRGFTALQSALMTLDATEPDLTDLIAAQAVALAAPVTDAIVQTSSQAMAFASLAGVSRIPAQQLVEAAANHIRLLVKGLSSANAASRTVAFLAAMPVAVASSIVIQLMDQLQVWQHCSATSTAETTSVRVVFGFAVEWLLLQPGVLENFTTFLEFIHLVIIAKLAVRCMEKSASEFASSVGRINKIHRHIAKLADSARRRLAPGSTSVVSGTGHLRNELAKASSVAASVSLVTSTQAPLSELVVLCKAKDLLSGSISGQAAGAATPAAGGDAAKQPLFFLDEGGADDGAIIFDTVGASAQSKAETDAMRTVFDQVKGIGNAEYSSDSGSDTDSDADSDAGQQVKRPSAAAPPVQRSSKRTKTK